MRQLTLLVAIIIAFFITLSLLLMSHTSSLRSSVLHNNVHTPASQTDDMAKQASGVSLDLLETDIARTNPITPALTQGHVIMPHLANETIKLTFLFGRGWLIVELSWEGLVGSCFILYLDGILRSRVLMSGRH